MRVPAIILTLAFVAACGTPMQEQEVWFVHATDPHLFEEPGKRLKVDVRKHQEKLNQNAFSALFNVIRSLPDTDARPRFLVLTGDFGIDRSWTSQARDAGGGTDPAREQKHSRADQLKLLAGLFRSSPVRDVYLAGC